MTPLRPHFSRLLYWFLTMAAFMGLPPTMKAGPVSFGVWYEFSTLGFLAGRGCKPADPAGFGIACTPSPVTPSTFADSPPYTFTAPASGAVVIVTDVADAGDIIDVFDFGVLIGTTSPSAVTPVYFGSGDPAVALTDPRLSHGAFVLGPGAHSITFAENAAAGTDPTGVVGPGGAHFFRVLGTRPGIFPGPFPALFPDRFPVPFQVGYASNLDVADSFLDITNTGAGSTTAFPTQNGNLCVNVYTFSPDEQLISCCACPITPNALASLSARSDLIGNTLTPGVPTSIVVKLLASTGSGTAGLCNAATPGTGTDAIADGMAAWGITVHALPPARVATYAVTEFPLIGGTLSLAELQRITTLCGFIQTNGSGFGICRTCRLGGLGASASAQ